MENSTIHKILEDFALISDIRLLLLDNNFRIIAEFGKTNDDFCTRLHSSKKCLELCIQSDINGHETTKKTDMPYKYTCPFGLYQGVIPIKKGGKAEYYIFISTIMADVPSGNQADKIATAVLNVDKSFNMQTLKHDIKNLNKQNIKKLDSAFDSLVILSEYIGEKVSIQFDKKSPGEMVKDYIDKNFNKKISLYGLSSLLHYSTVSITEHFRKEFGTTVTKYVLNKRVDYSKKLLPDKALTIKEIAEKCGFENSEYFMKCFKKITGVTPTQWRKKTDIK